MPTANLQLSAIFQEMADLMLVLGRDSFRVNSFARTARILGDLTQDLAPLVHDLELITAIPGIGKGTALRIVEFLQTGRIAEHDHLRAQVPPGLPELLAVPGLGPKTVALLWRQAGVLSLDDLKARLEGDALAKLPGMGPKKLDNLRKSIAFLAASAGRSSIGRAMPIARGIVEQLRSHPAVRACDPAGSLRRGRETIGDIDILAAPRDPEAAPAVADAFLRLAPVAQTLARGPTKCSVRTRDGLQVDLRIVPPDRYGAALMYFTGSREHNIALRQRAIERGMKLSEWGLFRQDAAEGQAPIAADTETRVYAALELAWVPPELREDRGELALAERSFQNRTGGLPALLELSDIRAELHAHTTASDGAWSIEELVRAAVARGYHTVAVTDHSKSQPIANGLSAERLERHILDVRAAAERFQHRITVLAGSEVDILADGSLDYPDSLLKELDHVVASPHSALSQEPSRATARLLRAIENRYVSVLGHPTGRLVNQREGLSPDIAALIRAAAARGVALEINANHHRLDLRDTHARAAIEAGCKLSINTDAHGPADLDELGYGVLTARRAGARAADVVNAMDRTELAAWLRSVRG